MHGRHSPKTIPMIEQEGVPYWIQDPQAETLAMMLFAEYEKRDGSPLANWIDTGADNREFYRKIARGEIPLIQS